MMESTKKRNNYLKDLFDVNHIDDVPRPQEVVKDLLEEIQDRGKKRKLINASGVGPKRTLS